MSAVKPSSLLVQLTIALCCVLIANFGVHALARTTLPRTVLARAQKSPPATELFLGNSLIVAGLDENALRAEIPGHVPLQLGLGATSPVEHLLIYREQARHGQASVFYGFFDTQLTDPRYREEQEHSGNRAVAYYTDPVVAARFYYPDSALDRLFFEVGGAFSLFVERYAVWGKIESFRRQLADVGMPPIRKNEFGRTGDFTALEYGVDEHRERCRRFIHNEQGLDPTIIELIRIAKQRGARLTVIEMPLPARHRRIYYQLPEWEAYRAKLIETLNGLGVEYLNASEWIADEGFTDILHLNSTGAKQFSSRLGRHIRAVE